MVTRIIVRESWCGQLWAVCCFPPCPCLFCDQQPQYSALAWSPKTYLLNQVNHLPWEGCKPDYRERQCRAWDTQNHSEWQPPSKGFMPGLSYPTPLTVRQDTVDMCHQTHETCPSHHAFVGLETESTAPETCHDYWDCYCWEALKARVLGLLCSRIHT